MRQLTARLGMLALAILLGMPNVASAQQTAQGEPYRIGIILPMTGTTADYGADFNRGALLAEEEINAAGGINGRPIKLVHGDSKNSPRDGVAEFRQLVDVEKLPAMISTMTGVIVPQFPLSRETGVPMICVGAITPEIRKGGPQSSQTIRWRTMRRKRLRSTSSRSSATRPRRSFPKTPHTAKL